MRRSTIFTLSAVVALGLSGCATAGLEQAQSANGLEAYKEFSRACDRFYAWPFSVTISCKAQGQQEAAIAKAVKEAVAEALAKPAPAAP